MNFVSSWLLRRAIMQYRVKLPGALSKDYGRSDVYLPAQVRATVLRAKLNRAYLDYAFVMYCTREACELHCQKQGLDLNYDEMLTVIKGVIERSESRYGPNDYSSGGHVGESGGGDGGGGGGE